MIFNTRIILIGLFSLLIIGSTACGDSEGSGAPDAGADTIGEDVPDGGQSTVSVRGEMERERAGSAEFMLGQSEAFGVWYITMGDASPWTYSLNIMDATNAGQAVRPEPGTYPIGRSLDEPGTFKATYKHVGDFEQPNRYFYNTNHEIGGTLTIETSTAELVSGSFEFRAVRTNEDRWETGPGGEVEVSGTFQARPLPPSD